MRKQLYPTRLSPALRGSARQNLRIFDIFWKFSNSFAIILTVQSRNIILLVDIESEIWHLFCEKVCMSLWLLKSLNAIFSKLSFTDAKAYNFYNYLPNSTKFSGKVDEICGNNEMRCFFLYLNCLIFNKYFLTKN